MTCQPLVNSDEIYAKLTSGIDSLTKSIEAIENEDGPLGRRRGRHPGDLGGRPVLPQHPGRVCHLLRRGLGEGMSRHLVLIEPGALRPDPGDWATGRGGGRILHVGTEALLGYRSLVSLAAASSNWSTLAISASFSSTSQTAFTKLLRPNA